MISFAIRAPLPWKYEFLIRFIHVPFELFLKGAIHFFSQELCLGVCLLKLYTSLKNQSS